MVSAFFNLVMGHIPGWVVIDPHKVTLLGAVKGLCSVHSTVSHFTKAVLFMLLNELF